LDHEKRIAETKPLHGKLMDRWEVVTVRWVAAWWKIVRMNSTSTRTRCDGKLDHELRPRKKRTDYETKMLDAGKRKGSYVRRG
jgi:hypothetical protein